MKFKITLIFLGSLISINSFALETNFVEISKIKAFNSQAYVYVNGLVDSNGCGATAFVRFYWSTTNVDKLWSMLLAAQMSGKRVAFDGECKSNYLSINSVTLES